MSESDEVEPADSEESVGMKSPSLPDEVLVEELVAEVEEAHVPFEKRVARMELLFVVKDEALEVLSVDLRTTGRWKKRPNLVETPVLVEEDADETWSSVPETSDASTVEG